MTTRRIYYAAEADPEARAEAELLYVEGEAGFVWVCDQGFVETDHQVTIPANSLHALHGHGVVEALNALPQALGPLGGQRDAVIEPAGVPEGLRILYEADRTTYGARHDLLVEIRDATEYRIVVDNREYQRTLSRLQFLFSRAMRAGRGVRIRV